MADDDGGGAAAAAVGLAECCRAAVTLQLAVSAPVPRMHLLHAVSAHSPWRAHSCSVPFPLLLRKLGMTLCVLVLRPPPLLLRSPLPACLQDKVGSRSIEGRKLRRGVLKGSVIAFITAGQHTQAAGQQGPHARQQHQQR